MREAILKNAGFMTNCRTTRRRMARGAALAIARLSFCHGGNPTARRDT